MLSLLIRLRFQNFAKLSFHNVHHNLFLSGRFLLPRLEFSNLSVDRFQKCVVLRQIEYVLLNPRLKLASHEIFAKLLQLLLRNQFEPNLIKKTEEPRVLERVRCHGRILDGQSAPQQLV